MSEENTVEVSNPTSVRYTYTNAPDYKVMYVNGVHGGNTATGELRFDFFQEFISPPDEDIHKVDTDGRVLSAESENPPEQVEFIRERKVGIIMTMGFARSLYDWLGDKIGNFDAMQAELVAKISQTEGGDKDDE